MRARAAWNWLACDGGSEIAEVAVVLPVLFTMLLGIIFFGRAYNVYTTVTYAAREGARVAAVGATSTCATCTPIAPTTTDVVNRVNEVLQASHIDVTQVSAYTPAPPPALGNCPGTLTSPSPGDAVSVYTNVQLNPGSTGPPACGVVVSFQYKFTFINVPFTTLNQPIYIKSVAQMQEEN